MGRQHPNVLKAKKQKRMRRAYLNEFNRIAVPRRISQNTPAPSNDAMDYSGMYEYRKRGKGFYDPYWDALFPGKKNVSIEKKYCMTRAEEERVINMLADEADNFLTVREGGITKTRVTWMFNRKKTRNFFVETCTHPSGMYIKKSMVYCAEERAIFAFKNNRIEWEELVPLAVDEPDPPSG